MITYKDSGNYQFYILETTSTGAYVNRYGITNSIKKGEVGYDSYHCCDTDKIKLDYSGDLGSVILRFALSAPVNLILIKPIIMRCQ